MEFFIFQYISEKAGLEVFIIQNGNTKLFLFVYEREYLANAHIFNVFNTSAYVNPFHVAFSDIHV